LADVNKFTDNYIYNQRIKTEKTINSKRNLLTYVYAQTKASGIKSRVWDDLRGAIKKFLA